MAAPAADAAAGSTYFDKFPKTFANLQIDPATNAIPTGDFIDACKSILGLFGD
jgi:hypothetical protein